MSENDSKFYYNKGIIYNEEGKYGLAVDNFKTALSFEPDSFEINFNLGVAYINKKEYSSAIECFKIVLKKSQDEVAALSNIALAYAKNNDFDTAVNYYKKVLELKPDDTATFKDLGDAYTKNKQYDNAIECYQNFLKIHPTSFIAKESLNTAMNLKKNHVKTNIPNESVVKNESQPISREEVKPAEEYFELAVNYVKEQNFDKAIENLRKCLKINSNYPNAYDLLNKLFKVKEKFNNINFEKQNIKSLAQEITFQKIDAPKSSFFIDDRKFNEFFTMGIAYYNAKNYNLALENFQNSQKINPSDKTCADYISEITSKYLN